MKRIIEICGDIFHFENEKVHRDDGPAIEFSSGVQWWVNNGKLHRDNGHAIIDKNSEYWIDGEMATDEEIKNIKRNKWIGDMI